MAKYFLGSVGEAEAYRVTSSISGETTMDLVFTSKTLTDSAVNISVNKEQIIDSYNGAPAGIFYHSPNVNITLSDILWNPKFVEASLGSQFNELCDDGNIEYYTIEATANSNGYVDLVTPDVSGKKIKFPAPIALPSIGEGDVYIVIGKLVGDLDWYEFSCSFSQDGTHCYIGKQNISEAHVPSGIQGVLKPGASYCFKYPIKSNRSKTIAITSRIIPDELFLVITTPIFMADSNSLNPLETSYASEYEYISTGRMVGKIVYEVPRWVLDSDLSFNFTTAGTAGMQLTGTVLESIDNEDQSVFMKLREFIKPRVWYEGLVGLFSSTDTVVANTSPVMYGIYADGTYSQIDSTVDDVQLVFKPISGTWTNASNSTYQFDNTTYNVTGKFSTASGSLRVYPAVTWLDDDNNEILVTLDDIYCDLSTNG